MGGSLRRSSGAKIEKEKGRNKERGRIYESPGENKVRRGRRDSDNIGKKRAREGLTLDYLKEKPDHSEDPNQTSGDGNN